MKTAQLLVLFVVIVVSLINHVSAFCASLTPSSALTRFAEQIFSPPRINIRFPTNYFINDEVDSSSVHQIRSLEEYRHVLREIEFTDQPLVLKFFSSRQGGIKAHKDFNALAKEFKGVKFCEIDYDVSPMLCSAVKKFPAVQVYKGTQVRKADDFSCGAKIYQKVNDRLSDLDMNLLDMSSDRHLEGIGEVIF